MEQTEEGAHTCGLSPRPPPGCCLASSLAGAPWLWGAAPWHRRNGTASASHAAGAFPVSITGRPFLRLQLCPPPILPCMDSDSEGPRRLGVVLEGQCCPPQLGDNTSWS